MSKSLTICHVVAIGFFVTGCGGDAETVSSFEDPIAMADSQIAPSFIPERINITVQDDALGRGGLSVPGTPAWMMFNPVKNIVICITLSTFVTTCYPSEGLDRSLCPNTERCNYEGVQTDGQPFVVSVFSINNLGKVVAEDLLNTVLDVAGDVGAPVEKAVKTGKRLNAHRARWRSSFILSDGSLSAGQRRALESAARDAVATRAMKGSVDQAAGALSAPMEICEGDALQGWQCEPLRSVWLTAETPRRTEL